jgi:DNA-binding NarL/FixJ family response regulator
VILAGYVPYYDTNGIFSLRCFVYPANLNTKEVVVLQCLADNMTVKQAAQYCRMKSTAVRITLQSILHKTKTNTLASAVAWSFRNKVLK